MCAPGSPDAGGGGAASAAETAAATAEEAVTAVASSSSRILNLLLVTVGVYFALGVLYNRNNGKRGAESVPNLELWTELPGLVYDGMVFFKEKVLSRGSAHDDPGGWQPQRLAPEHGDPVSEDIHDTRYGAIHHK